MSEHCQNRSSWYALSIKVRISVMWDEDPIWLKLFTVVITILVCIVAAFAYGLF